MSKVVVAATEASKEETLNNLRQWGLLHILPLQTPENEQVSVARAAFANAQKILEALPVAKGSLPLQAQKECDLLSQIDEVIQSKKKAEEALAQSSAELKRIEAFGELDPRSIRNLQKYGINIKLYKAEEKAYKRSKDFIVEEFKRVNGEIYFAAFSKNRLDLPYFEIALPSKSVSELKQNRDDAVKIIAECENKLATYAGKRKNVGELVLQASDELAFKAAGAGMRSEIGVCFIQGYSPKEKLASLNELAAKNGWGISVQEPAADEAVPTLLKHKKAVKPIDALYSVIGITPGYREIDVSSAFLFFFSIFFAMIVGDTVYGLLFVGITFFASKKLKDAPRYPFHFLYLMSGCTIIWGILNASYLGLDNAYVPAAIDICKAAWAPEGLKGVASWIRVQDNTKYLCFILAIIHLSIAHIWNAWANRSDKSAVISKAGWFCTTWTMFFLACNMVLGHNFPEPALYVGIGGVVLIVTGAVLKAEWFSIGMLPLNLVSNLVDVISYIRLFAVGMAGFSVANAFNGMVAPLLGSVPGTIGAALILLLVHALNIALAVMGVAVHAVRLNTLEFSNNVGIEWSGNPYMPFKKSI
jgi:V/A-type H+-transporting ATPase subunit I